ncbi:DUF4399 domain-containing protein [uncultured Roseobacter sp.]|uniref:DUF4399 domain-containing protein n=1 Tax=uncultured Roseobacter sp. TaxID=114847 RepID=UPI002633A916|nr:DUF4399 domain-containing protein [uncultured Roseobacter sp.]
MKRLIAAIAAGTLAASAAFAGGETPSNPDAEVYFVNLKDGDTVSSPVTIVFGLRGMGIAPAGAEWDMTGHHHLVMNRAPFGEGEAGDAELSEPIPADENHKHFGGGQTETTMELPAGENTLQLVLGDWSHVPHSDPIMSEVITITVE